MMNRRLKTPVLALGAGTALLLGSCAGGGNSEAQDGQQDGQMATVTETATHTVQTTMPQETGAGVPPDAGSDGPDEGDSPEGVVPGEQVETYFSTEGQEVGVAGLVPDEEPLVVRSVPSHDGRQVAEVNRLGAVELAGREWNNPDHQTLGYWAEVRVDGVQGWMPSANLYHFGGNTDVTEDYRDVPAADGAHQLVNAVAEQASGMADWIVLTTPDYAGEPFYRVDVTGMMDDSQAGERLFVTVGENNGSYEVEQVERTLLCHRGVSGGLCL